MQRRTVTGKSVLMLFFALLPWILASAESFCPQFQPRYIADLPVSGSLSELRFSNERDGWLLLDRNRLWRTFDGGKSWVEVAGLPLTELCRLNDLESNGAAWILCGSELYRFGIRKLEEVIPTRLGLTDGEALAMTTTSSGKTCVAGGVYEDVPQLPGAPNNAVLSIRDGEYKLLGAAIICTADKGVTWRRTLRRTGDAFRVGFILRLSPRRLVAFSEQVSFISDDGGDIWHPVNVDDPRINEDFPHDGRIRAVAFLNEQVGWTAVEDGYLYQTTDGGSSWAALSRGPVFTELQFGTRKCGFGVTAAGSLWSTEDGGRNWQTLSFNERVRAIAVGGGALWYTTDHGIWKAVLPPTASEP